jgi:hypothetical protein
VGLFGSSAVVGMIAHIDGILRIHPRELIASSMPATLSLQAALILLK